MEALNNCIFQEEYFSGQVLKKVLVQGSGIQIEQGSRIHYSESIYSDSSNNLLSSTSKKAYKIILYPEASSISPFDYMLLTLREGDEVLIKFPYTVHNIPEACWETIWYHLKILSVDTSQDLLSLPEFSSFLREHRLGPEKELKKRVLSEGLGNPATVNSRVLYSCEMILENGCIVETVTGRSYTLTRNISPGMHRGIHLALYTMRVGEKALIYMKPTFHVCEKFKANSVWGSLILENIEFCQELLYPQQQKFLEEVELKSDKAVVKRIVKNGQGPFLDFANKVWVEIQGRLEDGYQFQKPKEEVITLNGSKIYSEGLVLGISSMKRGETAWIKASAETHLYKEGYEQETLWFLITVKEYLEPYEKVLPSMPIEYKLELSDSLLKIANRLYSSGTKKECRTLYNDIITALKLKKDGFAELPDDLKPFFIDVRGRAMMNISLMLFKEAENSEKEDLKIKNAQKILEFCNELIKLNPKHNKAFFRKAQAFILKKEYNSALDELKRLLEIDPNNKDAKDLFKRIKRETQKNDVKEKKVYQGIFLGNKWAEESEKDEIETQKKVEIESKAFFEWKEEMRRKKDEEDLRRMEYETMVKQLEKGMIIDTNDSADPVTDLFLLDN